MLSTDARVAFAPETTYRTLIARTTIPAWRSLSRPALVLLVLAVGLPITAVHAITLDLMLRSAAVWSPIVLVQLAIGAVVIASAPARRVSFARAIDLWFAGHLPYSLWILALRVVTAIPVGTPHEVMGIFIILPLVWTTFIVAAFCRVVLGLAPAAARSRVALQLGLVVIVGSAMAVWAAGGPAAILSYALRRLSAT